jgi:hypothetical protein
MENIYFIEVGSLGNTGENSGAGVSIANGLFSLVGALIGGSQKKNQDARAMEQKQVELQIANKKAEEARLLLASRNVNDPSINPANTGNNMVYWIVGGVLVVGVVGTGIYFATR